MATVWRNRIIGYGEESPEQLLANPRNFRVHPKSQQQALLGVMQEVGVVDAVMVNQRTGFVVDGHLRVALAISEKQPMVPVTYVDLSEDEEALILATFDPIAAMAATDKAQLDALLRDVQTGEAAVQEMLAELANGAPAVWGNTSTDRDGQGVSSTWDQVKSATAGKVVIGDIETKLPADVIELLTNALTRAYEDERKPIYETLEAIVVAGVRVYESGDC